MYLLSLCLPPGSFLQFYIMMCTLYTSWGYQVCHHANGLQEYKEWKQGDDALHHSNDRLTDLQRFKRRL
ncbi:hypothetical protein AFCA_001523 [Aspergillus flavus]|nr:hypothetical protein AFCA_001523 [Aspergillus flavus]